MSEWAGPTTDDAATDEAVRQRARHLLEGVVDPAVFGPEEPLAVSAHHLPGEPVSPAEALRLPFEPFAVGGSWGPRWGTTWFHLQGRIPAEWAGQEVVLRLGATRAGTTAAGGEFLIFSTPDGRPVPLAGLSFQHAAASLTGSAAGGEAVDLYVEAAANPTTPEDRMVGDWPELRPDPGGAPGFVLSRVELAVRRPEVRALALDLRLAIGLAVHQDAGSVAARDAHAALAGACDAVDPADVPGSAAAARAALAPVLIRRADAATNGHGARARVTAVGHAHIDTAWLWPLRETVRKCARTFATAVTLMEDFPEYRFVCSAAQHLAWIEERYPELFARITERVRTGQFVPVGGMWVEADCNLASGEALVRQIVFGKRYFADRFGVDCRELWLPDAFGYTAALPQIMAAAGVDWFVSQKLSWNETNRFPHHTFWWEGIDGTRVRAHFPPADTYNGVMSLRQLFRSARAARSIYPFGYGDGGGGPTREMLEAARRINDLDAAPTVALEPPAAFFAAVEADPAPLPVWAGDLYLEKHRGTFTSQAGVKRGNRRGEAALQAAELWTAAAGTGHRPEVRGELDAAWRLLLTNQFHDILPGSSIRWVAEEAEAQLAEVERRAGAVAGDALTTMAASVDTAGLAEPAVVFNPTPFRRREVIDINGGSRLVDVPPLGWTAIEAAAPAAAAVTPVEVGEGWMDNGRIRVEWDADGRLTRVYDVDHGREILADGGFGNLFQLHEDRPRDYDAWDVDRDYLDHVTDLAGTALTGPVEVAILEDGSVEAGGWRGAVRFRRSFSASVIDQVMVLAAGSRRIDFVTEIDWHEDHKFLKVAFPVAVHTPAARFEIQFGHLARPTHANTPFEQARFEVCAQRWADLSEAGFGVALLNDCKYGYDVRGHTLRLSLLRAPTAPDPLCDRGRHRFTYALLPHGGDLAPVIAAGYALGAPLVVRAPGPVTCPVRPAEHSLVRVSDPGFVVETVKAADDGRGVIVRGYESLGGRSRVRLSPGVACTAAVHTDLLERDGGDVPIEADGGIELTVRPFELVTLRLLP
ncbi:MAG TPA: glycoside hydrolase family 38 C-terminal domain-containing protein [Acidimicrobiia bacterium]|nr:glycoside hydrolase family 38 C-terminal domain-containing protein [Acidimicrobiia bacterium]